MHPVFKAVAKRLQRGAKFNRSEINLQSPVYARQASLLIVGRRDQSINMILKVKAKNKLLNITSSKESKC